MAVKEKRGGPAILDINTGYLRDSEGTINLFLQDYRKKKDKIFTAADFSHYNRIINKLKETIN